MLRTGHLLRPASNPASRPRTGASLPGTLASPRTGLAPAGCPQLVAWLRHHNMNLLVVMAPKLLDALPDAPPGDPQDDVNIIIVMEQAAHLRRRPSSFVAAGVEDAGFWPVTSLPSTTT